ncbi:MAG: hypothetical protein M0017_00315 [Desulfobacteraceae bacterium]|nr:hypothetical protein [Desulfobacteraceae bacterium]
MANLQIKGMDDQLYEDLKRQAAEENRTVTQEVVHLLRSHLASRKTSKAARTPAEVLLELSGAWEDGRPAGDIVNEILESRRNSTRLADGL